MAALDRERVGLMERWTYHLFTLEAGHKAWSGGKAGFNSAGKVVPMDDGDPDLLYIGIFAESMPDNDVNTGAATDQLVNVNLGMEIEVRWWANDSGSPVTASDVGKLCYSLDDQTVTKAGGPIAGRVWAVDPVEGVAVQKLESPPPRSLGGLSARMVALDAFAGNALALESVESGAHYDVPTTGGASTITLPADADEGTIVEFSADGVKNGHTVTYRDGNGPTAITAALTASKRHYVRAAYVDGSWRINAYVSP